MAGVAAAACWGIATVMTKGVLEFVPPLTLLLVQLLCSNLLLWIIIVGRRSPLPPLAESWQLGLPGLLQPGLSFTTAIAGLVLISASVEALIWSLETILIMALAWVILGERVRVPLLLLALLGVSGVALVTVTGSTTAAGSNSALGNLLILIGTFCAALYTVLVRDRVAYASPLLITALNQAIGLLGVLLVWGVSLVWFSSGLARFTPITLAVASLSGIMLHALPFWLHTIVLQNMPASFAALFLILIPLFTISGASLFLNETLSNAQWIGAGLILLSMTGISLLYKEG